MVWVWIARLCTVVLALFLAALTEGLYLEYSTQIFDPLTVVLLIVAVLVLSIPWLFFPMKE